MGSSSRQVEEPETGHRRRHSDPSVAAIREMSAGYSDSFSIDSHKTKDDSSVCYVSRSYNMFCRAVRQNVR